jgi:hypothetical protein
VEAFCQVVALATEGFRREALEGLADPFSAGNPDPAFTVCALGIWSRIIRICSRPKETNAITLDQPVGNVLTDQSLRLRTMGLAPDHRHLRRSICRHELSFVRIRSSSRCRLTVRSERSPFRNDWKLAANISVRRELQKTEVCGIDNYVNQNYIPR